MPTNIAIVETSIPVSHFDFTDGKQASEKAPEFNNENFKFKFQLKDGVIADPEVVNFAINHFTVVTEALVRIIPQDRLNDFFLAAREKELIDQVLPIFFKYPNDRKISLDEELSRNLRDALEAETPTADPNRLVTLLEANLGYENKVAVAMIASHLSIAGADRHLAADQFDFIIEHRANFRAGSVLEIVKSGLIELCTNCNVNNTPEDQAYYIALTDFIINLHVEDGSDLAILIDETISFNFRKRCNGRDENIPLSIANIVGSNIVANGHDWHLSFIYNTTPVDDLKLRLFYLDKIGFGQSLRNVYDDVVVSKIGTPDFVDTGITQAMAINGDDIFAQLLDGIRTQLDNPRFEKFAIGMTIVHDFSDEDKFKLVQMLTSDEHVHPGNYLQAGKVYIKAIANAREHGYELPTQAYYVILSTYGKIMPFEMFSIARNSEEVAAILGSAIERVQAQYPKKSLGELLSTRTTGIDNLPGLVAAASKASERLKSAELIATVDALSV